MAGCRQACRWSCSSSLLIHGKRNSSFFPVMGRVRKWSIPKPSSPPALNELKLEKVWPKPLSWWKHFGKGLQSPQNNSHPTNYTANMGHFDDCMTLKMSVKPISLLQEHLPKILELTVFSINQLPVKYEHANRNKSLSPENWDFPADPAPPRAVPRAAAGLFVPAPPRMCQYVLCPLLLGDEPNGPHCLVSKNVIFLFSSFYFSPLPHPPPLTSLPSSAFKPSWVEAGPEGDGGAHQPASHTCHVFTETYGFF